MKPTHLLLAAMLPAALLAVRPAMADDAQPATALTPAQAEEVRNLVKEVLADSDQRDSLANGVTAGIDDKGKIFLKSEDGAYEIKLYGRVQTRYIWDNAMNKASNGAPATGNENPDGGFEVRRVNLGWAGHAGDNLTYLFELETRQPGIQDNITVGVALAYGEYQIADGFSVRAGKFYAPYTREGQISPYAQVAMDRTTVGNFFSQSKDQGVMLTYTDNADYRLRAAASNGGNAEGSQWNQGPNQIAGQARAEWLVLGSFADMNDNMALVDADKQSLLLGVAGYAQSGSSSVTYDTSTNALGAPTGGTNTSMPGVVGGTTPVYNNAGVSAATLQMSNAWGLTADATYKVANFSFFGAGYMGHARPVGGGSQYREPTPWGLEGEVDYRIIKQLGVFAQYDYINDDLPHGNNVNKPLNETVLGLNYFITSNLKLTTQVAWVISGDSPQTVGSVPGGALGTGGGLNGGKLNQNAQQVALQAQLQLNF